MGCSLLEDISSSSVLFCALFSVFCSPLSLSLLRWQLCRRRLVFYGRPTEERAECRARALPFAREHFPFLLPHALTKSYCFTRNHQMMLHRLNGYDRV